MSHMSTLASGNVKPWKCCGSCGWKPSVRFGGHHRAGVAAWKSRVHFWGAERALQWKGRCEAQSPLHGAGQDEGESKAVSEIDEREWVSVGVIGPSHGVWGKMKVRPTTSFEDERLGSPGPRWLQRPKGGLLKSRLKEMIQVHLKTGKRANFRGHQLWIVSIEGIDSVEKANELRGYSILIPADSRSELEAEDEFYVQDLCGLKVFKMGEDTPIGTVADVYDGSGGCDLLEISLDETEPRKVLVPFVEQFVPHVDLEEGKISIEAIDGLLDLSWDAKRKPKKNQRPRRNRRVAQAKPVTSDE